ncbi:MAG: [Bacteroidales bacterium]|nr:[FeFe] hydrogenase H-cluster maturation GTPase HydF [Bacteroidales bacterium]
MNNRTGNEHKPRIGFFGRRNSGKSSLINFLTGQQVAIVSATPGTTTDPVRKSMELSGVGAVVMVDTAGLDDEGSLGAMRVERSRRALEEVDLAVVVFCDNRWGREEEALVEACRRLEVAVLPLYSKRDEASPEPLLLQRVARSCGAEPVDVSTREPRCRATLEEALRRALPPTAYRRRSLLGDVVERGDVVLLVTPIDASAPEGRLILPQVQVLRDLLDRGAVGVVCQPSELEPTLQRVRPKLVVTDSQVFGPVSKVVPPAVALTSFSVVLARSKGPFEAYLAGTPAIDRLRDGDRVLILETCTHNVTCEDIGRVKLPRLLRQHTGRQLACDIVGGLSPVERPWTDYALVVQCGGCLVTERQLASRLRPALDAGVPVSNYGLAMAYMAGIFERSIAPFAREAAHNFPRQSSFSPTSTHQQ